ncbi:MAG: DUF58 domain-containing protein [Planctomycetota bacterium]|nr:DUF58 domain-containing protein [Planctomycetota bacterium]
MAVEARKYVYLTPEAATRFENMEMRARGIVEGYMSGMHRSPHHGFSIEFAEYREYVPGDPIRHIDWNVLARTDHVVIRQYEQETNLRGTVILDCSKSLDFKATSPVTKFQYGCYTAAALIYLLSKQQDAVGLVTHAGAIDKVFPPRASAIAVREMLLHLESVHPAGRTGLAEVYHEMAERLPRRSMVILITDLFDDQDMVASALRHFRHRRHEVILFHLLDDMEINFPYRGLIDFRDLETGERMEVEAELIREAVMAGVREFIQSYRKMCGDARIDYHVLNTAEPFDTALAAYLARRASM